ncbi:c-type cytochrome [Hyalangium versicolor]|uniref:c-type cytochrome n=1 Tax=Hyalangium versicolor TaxID=2861190 RepID=UPI001CCC1E36|nr:c-type cytochrome [Hyalangium versicolor]
MRWGWLVASVLTVGCGGATSAEDFGEELFQDSRLSESQFNSFSCATCHASTAKPEEGHVRAGYSLYNSAFRPSWWGGYETNLLNAVNFCYVNFMRGVSPLTAEDPKSRALYEYLVHISPDSQAPALPLTVVKDIQDVPRGSSSRGAEVYSAACQTCHGEPHTGKGRLTQLASILPEVTDEYDSLFPGVPHQLVVIEKVRHGQFFGVSGSMPLYSREALSDEDLGALLAFLGL